MKAIEMSQGLKRFAALFFAIVLAIGMSGFLVGCGGNDNKASSDSGDGEYADLEPVTLILANGSSKGSANDMWSEEIAKQASEITGGKMTIDYHCSDLGGDADIIRQEQADDIQMVTTQPAPMTPFVPALAVFDLPMAFATYDADQIESVINGDNKFTQDLQASFNEAGLHLLGWLQDGTYREVTSNKKLETMDDFKGFQIRTMENNNHMAFWKAVGAEPTPLAFSEVYVALQNGTVDGQENATDTSVGSSFQEVQKYLCNTNHILYANFVSINEDCWNNLDPKYQAALQQAITNATNTLRPQLTDIEKDSTKVMTDAGMEVINYDQSFFDDFLNNQGVKDLYAQIDEQTNGLSTTLVEELDKAKE